MQHHHLILVEQKQQYYSKIDLKTVATTMENAVAMLYAVALTTPLAITEETTTFNIGFGLSGSVSVDFTSKDGSDELYISKHGADPVDIKFTAE